MHPQNIIQKILSFLFPPSKHERLIANVTKEKIFNLMYVEHVYGVVALLPYADPIVRALIWQTKYKKDSRAIVFLGNVLARHLSKKDAVLIIPIPLSKERERARGFNQSLLVAESALAQLGHGVISTSALIRSRNTTPQTSLLRAERLTNILGAFTISDSVSIIGKKIILLDDVTTTGATLSEAKKILLAAGARSVECLALAH